MIAIEHFDRIAGKPARVRSAQGFNHRDGQLSRGSNQLSRNDRLDTIELIVKRGG